MEIQDPSDRLECNIERDETGQPTRVTVTFGHHHFVQVSKADGRVVLALGATHHGFQADASLVNGELEQLTNELCRVHPGKSF